MKTNPKQQRMVIIHSLRRTHAKVWILVRFIIFDCASRSPTRVYPYICLLSCRFHLLVLSCSRCCYLLLVSCACVVVYWVPIADLYVSGCLPLIRSFIHSFIRLSCRFSPVYVRGVLMFDCMWANISNWFWYFCCFRSNTQHHPTTTKWNKNTEYRWIKFMQTSNSCSRTSAIDLVGSKNSIFLLQPGLSIWMWIYISRLRRWPDTFHHIKVYFFVVPFSVSFSGVSEFRDIREHCVCMCASSVDL